MRHLYFLKCFIDIKSHTINGTVMWLRDSASSVYHACMVGFLDGNILIVILGKIVPCEQGLICRMAAPQAA